ncbi:MAG: nucleotidyltransferase domain-containing protein, partial [Alphaproteobacteria bacterium]|nr:nucleotidyltransferase domain-containing protein [Alphaproteobacteria bacterium]
MFNHFQYHTNLFPKIWNHDQTLNPMVCQSLLLMIKEYMFYLARVVKLPVSESDIQDIILHGSITNYYWDKHSDIDICLVLDLSKLREKLSGIDDFFLFQSLLHSWENNFYISIYGRKIDIWLLDE